uniref:Uncharacterized protein n=1 Tax=Antarctic circular DNA molecule TaxID=2664238 RepID=A0A5Q2F5D4_9ZZZZ|nr:hypothetical protein [Antarctic circular DNA molecule]
MLGFFLILFTITQFFVVHIALSTTNSINFNLVSTLSLLLMIFLAIPLKPKIFGLLSTPLEPFLILPTSFLTLRVLASLFSNSRAASFFRLLPGLKPLPVLLNYLFWKIVLSLFLLPNSTEQVSNTITMSQSLQLPKSKTKPIRTLKTSKLVKTFSTQQDLSDPQRPSHQDLRLGPPSHRIYLFNVIGARGVAPSRAPLLVKMVPTICIRLLVGAKRRRRRRKILCL